ncbi:MAG: hypothetical protein FWC97_11555 [Treponema sp.]|nr:hypothetical protein [Treponema sp.]
MIYKDEAEIDAIRIKLYEETKDMTKEEQNNRLRETGQRLADEFGFKIAPAANDNTHDNV